MKIILSLVLLCQGLLCASDVTTCNVLLSTARELNRKGQSSVAEKIYLTALANAETVSALLEVSAFYERTGNKECARSLALKAYHLDPAAPETLKAASRYEPGLLKIAAMLKDYNADLVKLAERHPEPVVIESLEERIAALHLERKWKKPFTASDLPGTWEGQSGAKLGRMRAVLNADGSASYDNGHMTWQYEGDVLTLGFNESIDGRLYPRKIIYKRQGDIFIFQEGARRNALTLKRVGGS